MRGLRVTLISDEHVPHMARLGEDVGKRISNWLVELGVRLQLGAGVDSLDGGLVRVPGNPPVEADVVLMASGVRPRGKLAEDAGLETEKGRVLTDEHMRASADGVFAVGDIALATNAAAGRRLTVEHWGEALNHGKAAGLTAAGKDGVWDAAPGFFSTIGEKTIKYVAWGDGYDDVPLRRAPRRRLHRLLHRVTTRWSACSPTSATRTTRPGASSSSRASRCRDGPPRARSGAARVRGGAGP